MLTFSKQWSSFLQVPFTNITPPPFEISVQISFLNSINLTLVAYYILSIGWPLVGHWMSSNSVYYKLNSTPFTWDPSCFYLRNSLKFQDQWLKVSPFGFTASSPLHPWKQPHCLLYPQQLLHHHSLWAHSSVHWGGHLFSWSPVALLTHCLYIKFRESDNHF